MIPRELEDMFFEESDELVIKAEDVAVLRTENQLFHAMLILSNSYVKVPVLDEEDRVVGAMTMSTIVKATTTTTGYNLDLLNQLKVEDVLEDSVPCIHMNSNMERILNELQDGNFLCVVDDDGIFQGIVTRKEVMARVNRIFHTLQKKYDLVDRHRQQEQQVITSDRLFLRGALT